MNKVCITGAGGFLGTRIVRIVSKDNAITTVGISEKDNIFCNLALSVPNFSERFNWFIHVAGKAHTIPKNLSEAEDFFRVNLQGTKNLLRGIENSRHFPDSFIFISTVAIYGLVKGNEITEDAARSATDPYGLSKIQAENYLLEWGAKYGVKIGIIRPPLILGHYAPGNLAAMIKGINNGLYFNIDNGNARRSMVLADDLANFIPKVVKIGGIYHLTDGYHPSYGEISKLIARSFNKKRIINIPYYFASILSKFGDLIQLLTRRELPFNSKKFEKMTSTLTFSDLAARSIGWAPRKVLDNPDLWL